MNDTVITYQTHMNLLFFPFETLNFNDCFEYYFHSIQDCKIFNLIFSNVILFLKFMTILSVYNMKR